MPNSDHISIQTSTLYLLFIFFLHAHPHSTNSYQIHLFHFDMKIREKPHQRKSEKKPTKHLDDPECFSYNMNDRTTKIHATTTQYNIKIKKIKKKEADIKKEILPAQHA